MLEKVVVIFVLLGTVTSDPVRRSITIPSDLITSAISHYAEEFKLSVGPEIMKSVTNLLNSVVGFKLSALEIGVKMMQWLISNLVGVVIGGVLAVGICKFSGKCEASYDLPFTTLYSLISSEQLESAENILISAIRRFGQEDKVEEEDVNKENENEKEGGDGDEVK